MAKERLPDDVVKSVWADTRKLLAVAATYNIGQYFVRAIRNGWLYAEVTGGANNDPTIVRGRGRTKDIDRGRHSQNTKAQIGAKAKARWADEATRARTRANMSEGARKRWADPEKRAALEAALEASRERKGKS